MHQKIVVSFYKYARIENAIELQKEQFELCKSLDLKGRILLGQEGINGSVCGTRIMVKAYKETLRKNPLFFNISFKEQETDKPAFRKLFVRIRKEIVHSGLNIDLKNTGSFIMPEQLKEYIDNNEDIILLDIRNDYESKIGNFRNAVKLKIKNFRDLPNAIKDIENFKNKKIVTYCTGGIRCEKASAFLKENGFNDVSQLKDGILGFCKDFPDTYWEGKCFVFDDRIAIRPNNNNNEKLANCEWCSKECDDYLNCHNRDCDKLFICCEDCRNRYNKSCSDECSKAARRRKEYDLLVT